jgi:hypothetical protein
MGQPFDILHGFPEKANVGIAARRIAGRLLVLIVGCGAHATSAESASSIVAPSTERPQPPTCENIG